MATSIPRTPDKEFKPAPLVYRDGAKAASKIARAKSGTPMKTMLRGSSATQRNLTMGRMRLDARGTGR